jgi:NAD(P)-dependent dehydrogenase (short-subunit alcohol dehydrogenase family)
MLFILISKHPMELNLGDTISIQTFASDITSQFPKVDCLICNAGVLIPNVPNDITTFYESELGDAENAENAETAIWYHENDEPSNQNQVFRR